MEEEEDVRGERGTWEGHSRRLSLRALSLHLDTVESACCSLLMPFRLRSSEQALAVRIAAKPPTASFLNHFPAYSADPLSLDWEDQREGKVPHVTERGQTLARRNTCLPRFEFWREGR